MTHVEAEAIGGERRVGKEDEDNIESCAAEREGAAGEAERT